MGPTELALEALAYIQPSGAINNATIALATDPQKRRLMSDLTATMQDIHTIAPALYKRRIGASIAAPAQASITVTAGSEVATTAYAFQEGATILLDGKYNELRTENGVKLLLYPFTGTTGTYTATFYDDCVLLEAGASTLLGPVVLNDDFRLAKRDNRQDFRTVGWSDDDYGRRRRLDMSGLIAGAPQSYWVEPFMLVDGANQVSTLRLRLLPLPREAARLGFDVKVDAPTFTVADIGSDATPSTKTLVVASNYVESIVRPMFLKRWSASPWFQDKDKLRQLAEDDKAARAALVTYKPQQPSNRRIYAPI